MAKQCVETYPHLIQCHQTPRKGYKNRIERSGDRTKSNSNRSILFGSRTRSNSHKTFVNRTKPNVRLSNGKVTVIIFCFHRLPLHLKNRWKLHKAKKGYSKANKTAKKRKQTKTGNKKNGERKNK